MLKKFLRRILEPRHYWRTVGFDELSELYVSQLLRAMGISLIGLFTPIYLYKLGYSFTAIALFHIGWFIMRPIADILNAFIVGKIGPKHTMLLGSLMHVLYLCFMITLKDMHWPLMLVSIVGSNAYALHILAVHVDFSKIKHHAHGGKELGYLSIVERVGGVLGPLVGGVLASYYDPRYTVALSMLLIIISSIPLFLSSEPVALNQQIVFRGLQIKKRYRDYVSVIPFTLENVISVIVWPFYAGVYLLGDRVYAKLGAIATLSTLSAIIISRVIGSMIDDRKGRQLLRVSVMINAAVHLFRPFVQGTMGVLGVNMINEPLTAAYRMPYMKGFYDAADTQPGYRIAYLASMNSLDSLMRLLFWVIVWIALHHVAAHAVFIASFIAAAIFSIGIMLERFEALKAR